MELLGGLLMTVRLSLTVALQISRRCIIVPHAALTYCALYSNSREAEWPMIPMAYRANRLGD